MEEIKKSKKAEEPKVEKAKAEPKTEAPKKAAAKGKLAVIKIRGQINVGRKKTELMNALKIYKKNSCSILDDTPSIRGMLNNLNNRVTWGEVDESTIKELNEKRGKNKGNPYCLNPPKGGFERKGIKAPYSIGGALGYRGKEIIKLIKKMI